MTNMRQLSILILILTCFSTLNCQKSVVKKPQTEEKPDFGFDNEKKTGKLPSIFNEKIKSVKSERIGIISMKFLLQSLKIAKANGWKGTKKDVLNIKLSDYPEGFLKEIAASESKKTEDLKIPKDLENLFLSEQAQKEITDEVFLARQEFLDYLENVGIRREYINEFNTNTFPDDRSRFEYHAKDDPNASVTGVQPLEKGGHKYRYFLQTIDLYLPTLLFNKSGILGDEPTDPKKKLNYFKLLRNIALRSTTYHEMTHILQAAVNRVNTPKGFKYPSKYFESVSAGKDFRWGDSVLKDIHNRDALSESQADGVAFVMLTTNYNMTSIQKSQVWDYLFGRLENGRTAMYEIMKLFDEKFPDYDPWDFASQTSEEFISANMYEKNELSRDEWTAVERVCDRIDLSAYAGYFDPLTPAQTLEVFEFMKKIHREEF